MAVSADRSDGPGTTAATDTWIYGRLRLYGALENIEKYYFGELTPAQPPRVYLPESKYFWNNILRDDYSVLFVRQNDSVQLML